MIWIAECQMGFRASNLAMLELMNIHLSSVSKRFPEIESTTVWNKEKFNLTKK